MKVVSNGKGRGVTQPPTTALVWGDGVLPCRFSRTVCRASRIVAGRRVRYALRYADRGTRYFVKIARGRESRVASFGADLPLAARVYATLVAGEVTPCTFADILHDLTAQ